ncbi:zinc metalloprotease HtpX [Planctomycetota bacterium]
MLLNNLKTTLLMGGLMGLCLAIGYAFGGPDMMVWAFLIGGVMNLVAFFFSDKIALATMRAKPVGENDDPVLIDMIEDLALKAKLPMPRVYVSPAQAPNAFATGRSPRHSAVCVTEGLRNMLNAQELEGVLAHELAHIKHRDVLISTIAAIVAGAIMMLSRFAFFFGGSGDNRRGNPLMALVIMILAPIAAMLIQMAISRSREYEADRFGAELAGSGRGLANALAKLEAGSKKIPLRVPDTQANMFIVQPLTGSRVMKLFMTHPPTQERIARLAKMG